MKCPAFRGVYNPNEDWNGWLLPYLTLGEIIRLKGELEKQYIIDKDPFSMRLKFGMNMTVIFYHEAESYENEVEPIMFQGRMYYAVHEGWCWDGTELHNDKTSRI